MSRRVFFNRKEIFAIPRLEKLSALVFDRAANGREQLRDRDWACLYRQEIHAPRLI
jgi:hypothetical protein